MRTRTIIFSLITAAIVSIVVVVILFRLSNKITRYDNAFIRNFPKAANKVSEIDLGYNSFYFAGQDGDVIYLGNFTTPLKIYTVKGGKLLKEKHTVQLDRTDLPFRNMQIRIAPPYFYAYDGTVSCIFSGNIQDWKAALKFQGTSFFDQAVIVDQSKIAFREQDREKGSTIGLVDLTSGKVSYGKDILQKQIDGIFDVDGTLVSAPGQGKLAYVYAYRNQYTVSNKEMEVVLRGNTIDTITRAKITVAVLKDRGQKKFSKPPLTVNKTAAISNNLLFISSGIVGRFEPEEMWGIASIVDVYNISDRAYIGSLYVHDVNRKKMASFTVSGNHLYALVGDALVTYKLDKIITSRYSIGK